MTAIDGARLPGSIPNVPGATLELLELESVRTGIHCGGLVALAVGRMFAPPIEDSAPLGEAPGQGTTRPPAPTIAPYVVVHRHPLVHVHLPAPASCVFGEDCAP